MGDESSSNRSTLNPNAPVFISKHFTQSSTENNKCNEVSDIEFHLQNINIPSNSNAFHFGEYSNEHFFNTTNEYYEENDVQFESKEGFTPSVLSNSEKNNTYTRNHYMNELSKVNFQLNSKEKKHTPYENDQRKTKSKHASCEKNSFIFHKNESLKNKLITSKKTNEASGSHNIDSSITFQERLEQELKEGVYECMVCCGEVGKAADVWSCSECNHIFHLKCIKKWASSPTSQISQPLDISKNNLQKNVFWRCPACQYITQGIPFEYRCFCKKRKSPPYDVHLVPHSCGEVCGKKGRGGDHCKHPCTILCHPGPCPPCSAFTSFKCLCGKLQTNKKCSSATNMQCSEVCNRLLNCKKHYCNVVCHSGSCEACTEKMLITCYCGKENKEVLCGDELSILGSFICGKKCNKELDCNKHTCQSNCHPPPCTSCLLLPSVVTHCPCGKVPLSDLQAVVRNSCLDAVPCCERVCGKELPCGEKGNRHKCQAKCHEGECPDCEGVMLVKCRCGENEEEMKCKIALGKDSKEKKTGEDKLSNAEEGLSNEGLSIEDAIRGSDGRRLWLCKIKCNKKLKCGRHRCSQSCCILQEHNCPQLCRYKLSCGHHRCEEPCHRGRCEQCWQVGWEELRCACGAEVLYPPIQCGTQPPPCNRPCTRQHDCWHPVNHPCHSNDSCPPCTFLVQRACMCGKEVRRNIPCFLKEVFCGLPCHKSLPCFVHKCLKTCHKGPCITGETCTQLCPLPRPSCGHPCNFLCHYGTSCPSSVCHYEIVGKCPCGRKIDGKMLCLEEEKQPREADYEAYEFMHGTSTKPQNKINKNRLTCDAECEKEKRNKKLAEALSIDVNNRPSNNIFSQDRNLSVYSEYVLLHAKKNGTFAKEVEKILNDLVYAVQEQPIGVNNGRKNHYFKPMNLTQRKFIHEITDSYCIQTQSIDQGTNRSVVATATKFSSKIPPLSLNQAIIKFNK